MAVGVSIETVETGDSAPTTPPHRISAQSGKDTLTFAFRVVADGVIKAWRARFQPTDRNHGKLIASRGMVCGTGDRCGSPFAFSLDANSPLDATQQVVESQIAGNPDGDYPVQVFAMESGEWSA